MSLCGKEIFNLLFAIVDILNFFEIILALNIQLVNTCLLSNVFLVPYLLHNAKTTFFGIYFGNLLFGIIMNAINSFLD